MWVLLGLNVALAVATLAVVVWGLRRIERRTAALESVAATLRAERATPPAVSPPAAPPADEWTPAKNARRFELIDREIDEVITPDEAKELAALQEEVDRYVDRVAPLPLDYARELHQQLLEKAARSEKAAKA